jgi:hypothetical protein
MPHGDATGRSAKLAYTWHTTHHRRQADRYVVTVWLGTPCY